MNDCEKFTYRKPSASPCNSLIVISSLDPLRDEDTTKFFEQYLSQEINPERQKNDLGDIKPEIMRIKDIAQLRKELVNIKKRCFSGLCPMIHFEAHGHPDTGMEFIDDNDLRESISWPKLLQLCRDINVACKGNLTVLAAACHSFELESKVSLQKKSPFFGLLGYESEATPDQIKNDFKKFYYSVFVNYKFPENSDLSSNCRIYTEYDLALMLVSISIKYKFPNTKVNLPDNLKKSSMAEYALTLVKKDFPRKNTKELRTNVKSSLKSSSLLIEALMGFMHNKDNLELLIEDIYAHFRKLDDKDKESQTQHQQ